MMILVMYEDGRTDMVPKEKLQILIEAGSITKFRRKGEWAALDHDMVRRIDTTDGEDDERRLHFSKH